MEWVEHAYAQIDFHLVDFLRGRYFWPHDNTEEEDFASDGCMDRLNMVLDYESAIQRWIEFDQVVPTPYYPPSALFDDDTVLEDTTPF